jgi:hypothetical protein
MDVNSCENFRVYIRDVILVLHYVFLPVKNVRNMPPFKAISLLIFLESHFEAIASAVFST